MTARLPEKGAQYILEATIAGRVYRFAEIATERDGFPYIGGMEVGDVSQGSDMFDVESDAPSVTVDGLVFPVDLAALEGRGVWLESGTAELARIAGDGRQTITRGRITNPAYDIEGTPASFAIIPTGRDERSVWPPVAAVVDASTFPDAPEGSSGVRYPFPIGFPGLGTAFPDARRGVVPSVVVDIGASETTVLVAGARAAATAVRMFRTDNTELPGENCAVSHQQDATGRWVAVATWPYGTGSGDDAVEDGATFVVDWSTSLGGIVGPDGTPLGPMGRLTEYLLEQSTVEWDRGAWASVRSVLDAYRVDGYLDEPAPPWETARSGWLWLAPMRVQTGPNGIEPIVWDVEGPEPRITLEVGVDCERVGDMLTDGARKANSYRIPYAPDRNGEPAKVVTLNASTSHHCSVSADNFGIIESPESLESRMLYDGATAARAMSWRAIAFAFPWRVRTVTASTARARALLVGDVVTLIDPEGGTDSVDAYVVDVERGIDSSTLTLTIIHKP